MNTISFEDFSKVDIRVGTVVSAEVFAEAKKPAYKLEIDFGLLGVKKSSAQFTEFYKVEELVGKQVLAVVNFPKKQIATLMSECLVLGAANNKGIILLKPEKAVPNASIVV